MMNRSTVVQSLQLNRLLFVPSFHFFVNQDRPLPASEISGAAERVHQLLLSVQVVNSKPTQLTQNEKYSTLDAVRENHLYYFPLNVPLIQMQKYF